MKWLLPEQLLFASTTRSILGPERGQNDEVKIDAQASGQVVDLGFGTIAFPEYLTDVRQFGYLLLTLTLLLMCWHEPLWWCLPHM